MTLIIPTYPPSIDYVREYVPTRGYTRGWFCMRSVALSCLDGYACTRTARRIAWGGLHLDHEGAYLVRQQQNPENEAGPRSSDLTSCLVRVRCDDRHWMFLRYASCAGMAMADEIFKCIWARKSRFPIPVYHVDDAVSFKGVELVMSCVADRQMFVVPDRHSPT